MNIRSGMEISPKTGIMIGSVLLMIALFITGFKADALMLGLWSSRWPQTTALIAEAKYWTTTSTTKNRSSITYHGEHLYTFSVGGVSYQGRNFDVAGQMHTGIKNQADQIHAYYAKGAEVPVFYDPADPVRCALRKGIAEDTQVALVFAAFFMAIGAMVLQYHIKRLMNRALNPSHLDHKPSR